MDHTVSGSWDSATTLRVEFDDGAIYAFSEGGNRRLHAATNDSSPTLAKLQAVHAVAECDFVLTMGQAEELARVEFNSGYQRAEDDFHGSC